MCVLRSLQTCRREDGVLLRRRVQGFQVERYFRQRGYGDEALKAQGPSDGLGFCSEER